MIYRPYQVIIEAAIYDAWAAGARKVLMRLDTGGGKTAIFAKIMADHTGASVAIAHRQELVGQISIALAALKVPHRIIAPSNIIAIICREQTRLFGTSYYDPNAPAGVAGVDTLRARAGTLGTWVDQVTLLVQDEDHHTLEANKWGTAAAMFPNAWSLGVTATPRRTDGKGLGRHADGLADVLILGPEMKELINDGYLTPYRIWAPPSNLDLSDVTISPTTGEYGAKKLKTAIRRSRIVGDVVEHYLKLAPGKLGLTFATDVETAADISRQFNEAGVPSEIIHAQTPDNLRAAILKRFENREILMIVNVDIFGEGFDCPAIEVIIMARPTQSLPLYMQQFGRGLRPMPGKTEAIIIDHAGNVARHGLPDAVRAWSLDRRDKRNKGKPDDVIPVIVCPSCTGVYEKIFKVCPYCGYQPVPVARTGPDVVDGDLIELDEATLAAMRGDIAAVDMDKEDYRAILAGRHAPVNGQLAHVKRHARTQVAQSILRPAIQVWAGYWRDQGADTSQIYRRFYFKFGTDVMSAQALRERDALALAERVTTHTTELIR